MFGVLGFSVILLLNDSKTAGVSLSPAFVALFSMCFAITVGVVWEIYEYVGDGILGLNMQKTILSNGVALVGHAAVRDTMKDLIVDGLGAIVTSAIGFVMMTKKPDWLNKFDFQINNETHAQKNESEEVFLNPK
jgi:uncharacterized membrane protein YjdF